MQINSRTKTIKLTKREKQTLVDAAEIVSVYAAQPFIEIPKDDQTVTIGVLARVAHCDNKGGDDD